MIAKGLPTKPSHCHPPSPLYVDPFRFPIPLFSYSILTEKVSISWVPQTELISRGRTPPNKVTPFFIHRVNQLANSACSFARSEVQISTCEVFNQSCLCRYVLVHNLGNHQAPGGRGIRTFLFTDRHRILLDFSRATSHTTTLNRYRLGGVSIAEKKRTYVGTRDQTSEPGSGRYR